VRALRPSGAGLRQTIDDFVVAFVPPSLPITDANLTCEKALLEVRRAGGWMLNAHLKALTTEPTAFILGFDTWRGYFGVTWGALNYPGDSTRVSSPTNILTVATAGTSGWIPPIGPRLFKKALSFVSLVPPTSIVTFRHSSGNGETLSLMTCRSTDRSTSLMTIIRTSTLLDTLGDLHLVMRSINRVTTNRVTTRAYR
jgi:hypothetical protein